MPMDNEAEHEFTPSVFDKITDERIIPIFTVKQMSQEDADTVQAMSVREAFEAQKKTKPSPKKLVEMARKTGKKYSEIVDRCLVKWENLYFMNKDGVAEKVEYSKDSKIEDVLAGADTVIQSVFAEILKISGMGI